jgi:hypothetical protein
VNEGEIVHEAKKLVGYFVNNIPFKKLLIA